MRDATGEYADGLQLLAFSEVVFQFPASRLSAPLIGDVAPHTTVASKLPGSVEDRLTADTQYLGRPLRYARDHLEILKWLAVEELGFLIRPGDVPCEVANLPRALAEHVRSLEHAATFRAV